MTDIGNVSKILSERGESFNTSTKKIFDLVGDKLTKAFQVVYNAPGQPINWTTIEMLEGSKTSVTVAGNMPLAMGEVIEIGEKKITVDETNINEYNKYVKFAFPIVMIELASAEELIEHVNRLGRIGSSVDVSPSDLSGMLDKLAKAFEEKILNDPAKISIMEKATQPKTIMGFDTADLTEEQMNKLKMFENYETGNAH